MRGIVKYECTDGVCTDAANVSITPNADLVPLDLNANAVLVHLMPLMDAEGNTEIKRLYTISCVTDDMKELLLKEVERIKMGQTAMDWLENNCVKTDPTVS